MIFKYIIIETGAILFGESTNHAQVAKGFKKVYSAGFVKISPENHIQCYGESLSLDIKSIPEKDCQIIKDLFVKISQIKYFGLSVKDFYETVQSEN